MSENVNYFSTDPFNVKIIPKYRHFQTYIINQASSSKNPTYDLAYTIKAINQIREPEPVKVPQSSLFFNFLYVSDYEKQFDFANTENYQEVRNFMVAISRIFSNRYTPFTLFRRALKLPVNYTWKVFKFLLDHKLINNEVNPETIPKDLIHEMDIWPQLLYTHDEQILTAEIYKRKIHPKISPVLLSPSFYALMCAPHFLPNDGRETAKVPGLMNFGTWPLKEQSILMNYFGRVIKEKNEITASWDEIAEEIAIAKGEGIASQIVEYPISVPNIKQEEMTVNEFATPKELIEQEVLGKDPNFRILYNATMIAGEEFANDVMRNKVITEVESAEQANAVMALESIRDNAKLAKEKQKAKILKLLGDTMDVLKTSIEMKRDLINKK